MVYACRGSRLINLLNGRSRAPTLQNTHKIFEKLFDFVGHDDLGVPFYRKTQLPCHSEFIEESFRDFC